ncbi:MAG: DJ-1/PfpI family protein [Myxococcota bacterium]|nr:DJ-1/PfpI family protein [Myxococcota bacterium]
MNATFGLLAFEDMEELDLVGPWEVFGMATVDLPDSQVVIVAEEKEPVRCAHGLRILPDHGFADAPPIDVLLVPGGVGTRREADNGPLIEWIAGTAADCRWVTSVCTGTLLLWKAGVVGRRRVTTHWGFVAQLREQAGGLEVLDNVRYVRDGNLLTAAGVSAGIDMALWLVGEMWDVDRARRTQRMMEYDPAPPYAAEV